MGHRLRGQRSDTLLTFTRTWQRAMLMDWCHRYPQRSVAEGHRIAQQVVLTGVALGLCGRRRLIPGSTLTELRQSNAIQQSLVERWQQVEQRFGQTFPAIAIPTEPSLSKSLLKTLVEHLDNEFVIDKEHESVAILGQIYEASLEDHCLNLFASSTPSDCHFQTDILKNTQKRRGSYYTPIEIVEYVIETVLPVLVPSAREGGKAQPPRILDLSCGGGAFLLAAYQALLDQPFLSAVPPVASLQNNRLCSFSERVQILSCLYGVDIDPQAVEVTRLSLLLKLLEFEDYQAAISDSIPDVIPDNILKTIPDLSCTIRCGNAVIGCDAADLEHGHPARSESLQPLDWQQAFPEVMATGGFDAVIGNPPYLDAEWMTTHLPTWRSYCNRYYQTASGNWDLFCVFIEQALRLCRPGGCTSLVVPNKLFSADYAAPARRLLAQTTLLAIRDYTQVAAFAAAVYPVVYVAQKVPPPPNPKIRYEQMQTLTRVAQSAILPLSRLAVSDRPWIVGLAPLQLDLIERLRQTGLPLGQIMTITGAATVAEAYALQPILQDDAAPKPGDFRFVNSGTIDRYCLLWGIKSLRYLGATYPHPMVPATALVVLSPKRQMQAKVPKIIVAGLSRQLECAWDATGSILAGKSTVILRGSPVDWRYLLGLLNSQLLSFYFRHCYAGNQLQGGYIRIGPSQIRQLPIYLPNLQCSRERERYEALIELVNEMLHWQSIKLGAKLGAIQHAENHVPAISHPQTKIQTLDQAIDQQVYDLYRLTDADIELVTSEKMDSSSTSSHFF
ncbi:MAG: N-6 DNA methylase [Synechococcales cyanobacterium M58_A2018_015]|nr:N-6 DNA methylase [Synechococcales cyanobacterium M58_A2018_015]